MGSKGKKPSQAAPANGGTGAASTASGSAASGQSGESKSSKKKKKKSLQLQQQGGEELDTPIESAIEKVKGAQMRSSERVAEMTHTVDLMQVRIDPKEGMLGLQRQEERAHDCFIHNPPHPCCLVPLPRCSVCQHGARRGRR